MAWVVDTCLLLDIALPDPIWMQRSATILDTHLLEDLVVCPITIVELAPHFRGGYTDVYQFLDTLGANYHQTWLEMDTRIAMQAWATYVQARRRERIAKRPIADILIGAFAQRFQGLLTRNPNDFRPWLPNLNIIEP